jgi:hypothetical protein
VVGCLPGAPRAAAILARDSVNPDGEPAAALLAGVAEERGITWPGDLAHRLAAKINQQTWIERWRFVAALLRAEGVAPRPATASWSCGWARWSCRSGGAPGRPRPCWTGCAATRSHRAGAARLIRSGLRPGGSRRARDSARGTVPSDYYYDLS